jgi:hypothetical protein
MGILEATGTVLVAIVSFGAGWLLRTERMRSEVYTRKLDVYLKLNALAANLLHHTIRASVDPDQFAGPMYQARIELAECMASHTMLVSKNLGPHIEKLVEAKKEPDPEAVRQAFNLMSNQMAAELKLENIHSINAALLSVANPKRGV